MELHWLDSKEDAFKIIIIIIIKEFLKLNILILTYVIFPPVVCIPLPYQSIME